MLLRLILPEWVTTAPGYNKDELPRVIENEYTDAELRMLNEEFGYNCYWLPNFNSNPAVGRFVDGVDIDSFHFVFVDMDLKEKKYESKDAFLEALAAFPLEPTYIVDSGNGIHAYWQIEGLQVIDYLLLQRRLARQLNTDLAVGKIFQLMRLWGTLNTKKEGEYKPCELLHSSDKIYTAEDVSKHLAPITSDDQVFCQTHHDRTYGLAEQMEVSEELPAKWFAKFPKGSEGHMLYYGTVKDRSAADFRLAHLLLAQGFTKEEGMSVLMNTSKASSRTSTHRYNYAENIVGKVWTDEAAEIEKNLKQLSKSVREILGSTSTEALAGTRFPCSRLVDATVTGFRLGHVLGLIGGAGAGKSTNALNYFYWFCENNPEYMHLFVSLEQPVEEIAKRWHTISADNPLYYDSVHVLGNYNDDGTYRNLSLQDIEDYIKVLEKESGRKVGCVVIDHIGVLKQQNKLGEFQGIQDICTYMKSVAVNTQTFLIMQSQAPREKAGIGDLELDKDAAYGTSKFEWYCDYIVTTWQPLKRMYHERPDMTVTCFKYCKIRHKDVRKDEMKEDVRYALMFDPTTERLRKLTDDEKSAYSFLNTRAVNARKMDKKTDPGAITDITWDAKRVEKIDGKSRTNSNA